ncbi:DeoR/GlpR family DNA-binding transcription regulator [Microbacterium excoecariae]|uniref:DeoR/GlpR family DNA-binding transcription regulator n=1 Tax=Microbacterium excoecariae TaxID=2715210 RepID=UPI00140C2EED|nr:DeoR/GlpR family DNA-binding transcription regulator [Microbacterium excoecariae]NHI17945.1 DeoR/GlpR transcriptional regulator [Microbacterium excoecariae]
MYPEERQGLIARAVTDAGRISVREIAARFDITTETVRRDLQALEEAGALRRVHGGAIAPERASLVERAVGERRQVAGDAKRRLAEVVASRIPDGFAGSVFLDAGTTTGALLDPLARRLSGGRAEIVTHAVQHAAALAETGAVALTLLGGRIRALTGAAVGAQTVREIAGIRPDVALVGVNGISADFGLSTPDGDEAAVKRAIVRAARRVIVVADRSKFGSESLHRFAGLDEVDAIATDQAPEGALAAALAEHDVEVWAAPAPEKEATT